MERIRRLNQMVIGYSRESGIEIVDLDRQFALFGARRLGTNYLCLGEAAVQAGTFSLVNAILVDKI